MNVFVVSKDGELITPELTGTILEGVTRESVLVLARELGLTVIERRISVDEVLEGIQDKTFTELFACGTAASVTPIGLFRTPDRGDVAICTEPGEVTMKIRNKLLGIQYGTEEDTHHWMVKVTD
ncbi:NADH:ubiquinone oxidoreductase subunit A [Platysternon megacephalum]|uniref:NADH:ubiquinone oxidoreductase subunit A n=1 Tax=Platysternon megacephalum TaxID=55544 RepID=A0A4D9DF05_9SAUR|nr:NADH:ubiquinone oxidoreductase subunit A [Platysternon megacephalum]